MSDSNIKIKIKNHNGCTGYLNTYDYENCFTCSKDCGGFIFYHPYKFSTNSHCIMLDLKQEYKNINLINLYIINVYLTNTYTWDNAINMDKLKNISVYIL